MSTCRRQERYFHVVIGSRSPHARGEAVKVIMGDSVGLGWIVDGDDRELTLVIDVDRHSDNYVSYNAK